MGLAASQARLLTITARLADNELRSQTINNAKMRLATQSSQASDEYISALNNAQLMFSNTDINGLARTQALTFNNLISYSQYNNQYGLVNSAGLLLVNEQDAAIYEKHKNDLEGFLGEYGLKWDTSFFDNPDGGSKASTTILSQKLSSFYGTGYNDIGTHNLGDFFAGMTNADLEELYLNAISQESSIERMNYDIYAKEYYNEVKDLYDSTVPAFRQIILGDSGDETQEQAIAHYVADYYARWSAPGVGEDLVRQFLKTGKLEEVDKTTGNPTGRSISANDGVTGQAIVSSVPSENKYALNNIGSSLTASGRQALTDIIDSLIDKTSGAENMSGFKSGELTINPTARIAKRYEAANGARYNYTVPSDWPVDNTSHSLDDLSKFYDYSNYTPEKSDDVYRTVETTGSDDKCHGYNGNGDGFEVVLPGMTVYIDIPQYEEKTVTWQTLGVNDNGTPTDFSDDEWNTGEYIVLKPKGTYKTYCEFGGEEGVTYDSSTQSAIQSWLAGKTRNSFSPANLNATMTEFASRFQGQMGADNDGKPGDRSDDPVNFKWESDKQVLAIIPLHEAVDPEVINNYGNNASRYDTYKLLIDEYFNMLNSLDYFDVNAFASQNGDNPYLQNYQLSRSNFTKYDTNPVSGTTRGNGSLEQAVATHPAYLMNFVSMLEGVGSDIKSYGSDAFKSVLGTYLKDLMLDVLGEPKYAWVDENDPAATQNSDAKAQWYSNLFNRMQKGYKVLENGLANSKDWIEYAFESGLVTMEQVDKSFNWVSLDYKTCSNIFEESDTSDAVARAEAKYNRAMNDVKQKDNMFDLQLKNIDTEHQSLQTEYDSVKTVMNKNIERTMKFDQSA